MNTIDKKAIEIIESKEGYISYLVNQKKDVNEILIYEYEYNDLKKRILELEQTQKELIEFLRLEHQCKTFLDEWVYCHELEKCPTCKLIQRIVGEK